MLFVSYDELRSGWLLPLAGRSPRLQELTIEKWPTQRLATPFLPHHHWSRYFGKVRKLKRERYDMYELHTCTGM
jgi:hypothetical protein